MEFLDERKERQVKGKCEFHPRTGHEGPAGEYRYNCTRSLISALDVMGKDRHGEKRI